VINDTLQSIINGQQKMLLIMIFTVLIQLQSKTQPQTTFVIRGGESHAVSYFSSERSVKQQWLNPYLDENWQAGRVVLNGGDTWEAHLRLDLYRKELELVMNGDSLYVSEPFAINYIELDGRKFVYRFYTEKVAGDLLLGSDYFEQLNTAGPVSLLLQRSLRVDEQRMAPGNVQLSMNFETKSRFATVNRYFLQTHHEVPAIKIKRNKRQLLKLLNDERAELKRFARSNRKSFRNPAHMAEIIDHYNQLKTNSTHEK